MRRPEDILAVPCADGEFCRSQQLTGPRVAAAVSGGADSIALLRLLPAGAIQVGFSALCLPCEPWGAAGQAADRTRAFVRAEVCPAGVPLQVFGAPKGAVPDNASEGLGTPAAVWTF